MPTKATGGRLEAKQTKLHEYRAATFPLPRTPFGGFLVMSPVDRDTEEAHGACEGRQQSRSCVGFLLDLAALCARGAECLDRASAPLLRS